MSTATWNGSASNAWANGANWSGGEGAGGIPNTGQDVHIVVAGSYNCVVGPTSAITINSLIIDVTANVAVLTTTTQVITVSTTFAYNAEFNGIPASNYVCGSTSNHITLANGCTGTATIYGSTSVPSLIAINVGTGSTLSITPVCLAASYVAQFNGLISGGTVTLNTAANGNFGTGTTFNMTSGTLNINCASSGGCSVNQSGGTINSTVAMAARNTTGTFALGTWNAYAPMILYATNGGSGYPTINDNYTINAYANVSVVNAYITIAKTLTVNASNGAMVSSGNTGAGTVLINGVGIWRDM